MSKYIFSLKFDRFRLFLKTSFKLRSFCRVIEGLLAWTKSCPRVAEKLKQCRDSDYRGADLMDIRLTIF